MPPPTIVLSWIIFNKKSEVTLTSFPPHLRIFFTHSGCFYLFFKFSFYWAIVALQYCVSSYCVDNWISYTWTYTLLPCFLDSFPLRSLQSTGQSSLCYTGAFISYLFYAWCQCVCVYMCVCMGCVCMCVPVCVCMCVSIPSSFFSFIFISWRLITLQYCSGFCHTLTWISHGFTCVPHPEPPSHIHPKLLIHPPFPSPFFINKFVLYFCVSLVAVKIVSLSVLLKAELWETLMWLSSCFLCPDYMYLFEA